MAFDNMDDIISQRSQASMSGYNGSEAGLSSHSFATDPSLTIRRRRSGHSKSSSLLVMRGTRNATISSEDEVDGNIGLVNHRIVRRHSAQISNNYTESLEEGGSSTSSVSLGQSSILENRFNHQRSVDPNITPKNRVPLAIDDSGSDDDLSSPNRNRGLLSCLGCFNGQTRTRRSSGGFERMENTRIISSPGGVENSPANNSVMNDPVCRFVGKALVTFSERLEIEANDALDKRLILLLFSALSGEPILTENEYAEIDEWIDWLDLGYSSSSLDSFERDVNRHGSQGLGLLYQIFFALEYTEIARLCCLIIRNVHLDPPALFGLFAINCAKWTRDVVIASMRKFDSETTTAPPPILTSTNRVEQRFASFLQVVDWWVSRGAWGGGISSIEQRFGETSDSIRNNYESLEDNNSARSFIVSSSSASSLKNQQILGSYPATISSVASIKNFRVRSRIADIDINISEDWELLRQSLILGGVYYSYCVISFANFWLEKDLLSVDSDTARERLNNAYLDKEFVSKLSLNPTASVSDIVKKIDKVSEKLNARWRASGWRKQDLLSRKTPNSSRIDFSDDDDES
jgi:hypothetical protein